MPPTKRPHPVRRTRAAHPEIEAKVWGDMNPPGTRVRYWTGAREGEGKESVTRSYPGVVCGTAVVWVRGCSGCVALSHVEVLK